jgi:hypothetical protein
MHALTAPAADFSLHELEQVEEAIEASQRCIATLIARRNTLTTRLDEITRPPAGTATARVIGPGVMYRGKLELHWSAIGIHMAVLKRLWTDFPDQRDAMAAAMAAHGHSRTYVARRVSDLFPGRAPAWAHRYSRPLVEDWMVDTNLNRERIRRLLVAAVHAVGLTWNVDVKIYWRPTRVPVLSQEVATFASSSRSATYPRGSPSRSPSMSSC